MDESSIAATNAKGESESGIGGACAGTGTASTTATSTSNNSTNSVASISAPAKSAAFKRRLAEDLFPLHKVKSISSINTEFGEDAMSDSSVLETAPSTGQGHFMNPSQGLISNVWHTQLALWTFTLSTVLTTLYRGKFRPQTIIFACFTLTAAFFVSWALVILVVAAHLFNTRKNFFALAVFRQRQATQGPAPLMTGGHDDGWMSPQKSCRSMSTSSQCSSLLGSVPGSGACSPTGWKKQPVFWQRKMSVEQTYFGTITPSSRL